MKDRPRPNTIHSLPDGPLAAGLNPRPRRPRDDGSIAVALDANIANHKIIRIGAMALVSVLNCVMVAALVTSGKDATMQCVAVELLYGIVLVLLLALDDLYIFGAAISKQVAYWQHIATRDSLTGLYNNLAFLQALDKRIAIAEETRARYGVMFIDLNKFKQVNDTFGHAVGDSVLTTSARRILNAVGPEDLVARLGGDEFAVLLMRTNVVLARKLEVELENLFQIPIVVNGHNLRVGASIGTCLASDHHKHAEDVIHAADILMYRQKAIDRWSGNTRMNHARMFGIKRSATG